ncbi:unnamed protein product, partial [Ilex paraguariensis]
RRRLMVKNECFLSGDPCESSFHVFVACPFAKVVWEAVAIQVPTKSMLNIQEWLVYVSEKLTSTEVVMVAIISWALWFNRNKVRVENCSRSPQEK